MPSDPDHPRLSHLDPWGDVAKARADRGPVVAGWCASILVRLQVRDLRRAPELGARLRAGLLERTAASGIPPGR